MKYVSHAAVALCLLTAVQRSDSQERIFDFGATTHTVTAVSAQLVIPSDSAFGSGTGWYVGETGFREHDLANPGENGVHAHSACVGTRSDHAGPAEIAKQAIIVDAKLPISAFDIVGMDVDQKSNGYLIRIHCTRQLPDFESWLKAIGDDTWLYITLADAKADVLVLEDFELTAFVTKVLVFQSATSVQLTFKLSGQVNSAEIVAAEGSQDILALIFTPAQEQP